MDTLGRRIASLRKSYNLSQRQLMDLLNFSNLSRFEKDERKPGIDIIISLADFFNISIDWLLTGKEKNLDVILPHQKEDGAYPVILNNCEKNIIEKFRQLDHRDQEDIKANIDMKYERMINRKDSHR